MKAKVRAAVALLVLWVAASVALARDPSKLAPASAPSSGDVAPAGEPGERLEVKGVVYAADGRTPVPNASVYVYQTDARGLYRPDDPMGNQNPRLMLLLRSDAAGRYSYRTIRPASYPGTRVPQHIHYEVAAPGHGTRIFEIVFEQDPLVTADVRTRAKEPGSIFSLRPIVPTPGGAGQVTQDVVLGQATPVAR
jgi:protocatechuate 3,4-dioxygenase beta subunit